MLCEHPKIYQGKETQYNCQRFVQQAVMELVCSKQYVRWYDKGRGSGVQQASAVGKRCAKYVNRPESIRRGSVVPWIGRSVHRSVGWVDRSISRLVGGLVGRSVGRWSSQLVKWSVDRGIGELDDRSVS